MAAYYRPIPQGCRIHRSESTSGIAGANFPPGNWKQSTEILEGWSELQIETKARGVD